MRFQVGDDVKRKMGPRSWKKGVVSLLTHDPEIMDPGYIAPYTVELLNGERTYAPEDSDEVIRRC